LVELDTSHAFAGDATAYLAGFSCMAINPATSDTAGSCLTLIAQSGHDDHDPVEIAEMQ